MTDDIVTRLREQVDDEFLSYTNVLEAADEIERLRKALQLMSIDMTTQLVGIKMRCKCGACD